MKKIENVICGIVIIIYAGLFAGCFWVFFQMKPAKQPQEYVTHDEVHAIVDSILTEIYD
ncbi:MAG: hypothetical protein IJV36_06095 [Prevotella sp.]|nr:hypothetical protein [Prevotella sp.]